ncbi:hypothetical protein VTK73DRAFT_7232 [Phialemonium thermophilum]|uniref:Uncharacterized protein n=1 Tax=Phialemonium thermophilum TaxID=223376 RepID=A0ABR3WFV8_9PEZI
MDPLSVAVNILTLITVAGKTAQGLERLIAVHDAPRELFAVLSEVCRHWYLCEVASRRWLTDWQITALRLLLGTVETSLKSVQDSTNPSVLEACRNIAAIRSHLLTVFLALDDLVETKLRKQSAAWGIHRTQVAKVSWLRYASDMRRLLADLRAQTALLSTAMTALNVIQTGSLSSGGPTPSVTFTIQGLSIATSPPADNAEQVPLALQLEQMLKRLSLASPGNGGSPVPQRIEDGQETTAPEEEARGDDEEGEPSFVPTAPGTSGTDGRDETSHAEPSQVVALRATTSTSTCPRFCHCQCHVYTRVRTPKWAKDVFGSIILQSNTALTLARKPCNYLGCRRSGSVAAQFTYYAPAWVWMRAVHVTAARQSVFGLGASVSFSFPRRTPRARIWQLIFVGSVDGVREELETGRASIYDIDAEGESILHVRITFCPHFCLVAVRLTAVYSMPVE